MKFTNSCLLGTPKTYNKSHKSGSFVSMFIFTGLLISLCVCCSCAIAACVYCCFKKAKGSENSFINRGGGVYVPPNNPGYPTQQGFNMQTRTDFVQVPMQDPDEAFKVNNSPPPYSETVKYA